MRNRTGNGSVVSLILVIALAVVCGGLGQRTEAQCETKLLASDGSEGDLFGKTVSIDGNVMVVGAWGDDNNTGTTYVYRYYSSLWGEEIKLLASDGASDDDFGSSVSIDGDVMVVGADGDDDNGDASGSAYVYRYDGSGWIEEAKLLASDGDLWDRFGSSVSISGDVVVVGAYAHNDNGNDSGSVYVYRYDGSGWIEEAKLLASDGAEGDLFGFSVSIGSDAIVVGAYGDDVNGGDYDGSAYVYRYDGSGWIEEAKLLASDGAEHDLFGFSVSINGDAIIVGAFYDEDNGQQSGSAYVYRYDGYGWTEEAKLLASDGEPSDQFGSSVSIDSDVIVVGAHWDNENGDSFGSAYVYRYDGYGWIEEVKLMASDGETGDCLGESVSIDGDVIVAGAFGDDDNGSQSGSAYVYDLGCGTLAVSPDPLLAGQDATFTSTNLNPYTQTFLAYSLRGLGSTYIAPLNVTLDLDQPAQAGEAIMSDGSGTAQWILLVPYAGAGKNVWFQVCQYELTTNVVATSIE